jgi:hypothetical protein
MEIVDVVVSQAFCAQSGRWLWADFQQLLGFSDKKRRPILRRVQAVHLIVRLRRKKR